MSVPLKDQIDELARELRGRRAVYPRLIAKRILRRTAADDHLARLRAALATLKALRRKQRKRKAQAAGGGGA